MSRNDVRVSHTTGLRSQSTMPPLESLRTAVQSHAGTFHCCEIHHEVNKNAVAFRHIGQPPDPDADVPGLDGLPDFYATFSQLRLYVDEASGDAAFHIAHPSQWAELDDEFRPWIEADDELPEWVEDCLVIGEVPQSGNYLLVATSGPEAGKVFKFEHDGFEFIELGSNLPDFVTRSLDLDSERLTDMASHLRFVVPGEDKGWWIEELRDNRGNNVRTAT